MHRNWQTVPGWLSAVEGETLQRLAAGRIVLELGSYFGRSTVCMAAVADRVVSVDTHQGDANTGPADTLADFHHYLDSRGMADRVEVVVSPIESADLPPAAFDLVFIDAQHDAHSVERHTRIALRCLRPGGVIAWHDWNYPTVVAGAARAGLTAGHQVDCLGWAEL